MWGLIKCFCVYWFDIFVLLMNFFCFGVIVWFSGVKKRVGYDWYNCGFLLIYWFVFLCDGGKLRLILVIDYYFELVYEFGCEKEWLRM